MGSFAVHAGDLLCALVELVDEPRLSGFDYYATSAKLEVNRDFGADEISFEITLLHEPTSEEAAVEEDRLRLVLREDSDVKVLTTEARKFIESNWRS